MRDLRLATAVYFRAFCALAVCAAIAGPLQAQTIEAVPPGDQMTDDQTDDKADDLLGRGAKMILRGLLKEVQPHLDELSQMVAELEPVMREMARMVDDVRNYDTPRLLPNGDILIPRRPGAPPSPLLENRPGDPPTDAPLPGPSGEIEL